MYSPSLPNRIPTDPPPLLRIILAVAVFHQSGLNVGVFGAEAVGWGDGGGACGFKGAADSEGATEGVVFVLIDGLAVGDVEVGGDVAVAVVAGGEVGGDGGLIAICRGLLD